MLGLFAKYALKVVRARDNVCHRSQGMHSMRDTKGLRIQQKLLIVRRKHPWAACISINQLWPRLLYSFSFFQPSCQ